MQQLSTTHTDDTTQMTPISIFKKIGIKGPSHSWHYTVWCKQNEVNRASKQNLPPILACAALNCHTTLLALEQDFTSLEILIVWFSV